MKKILVLVCLVALLCGCGTNSKSDSQKNVSDTLEKIIAEDNYIIVDVRTKEEYAEGHVVGALNIPYDELASYDGFDDGKTIMVYCRSGRRSAIAYETLKKKNYDVYDLGAFDTVPFDKE